jgi:hypothetical protein
MPIDDFLAVSAPPPVSGADLGVPDLPPPPQAPMPPQPRGGGVLQTILSALPGVLGGAMGPGAGTGLMQGYVSGQMQNEQRQRLQHQDQMRQFQMEQQAYSQQAQQAEIAKRQREQILQQNLTALRSQVKDLPDKAAYDAYVEAYGNGLQSLGYRLDANWLRKSVPYVAPKADAEAWQVLERWQKLPNNKELLEKHPEQAANAMIPFDRDGDGEPELMSLRDLSVLAGAPLAMTAQGQVFSNPGTPLDVKANADGILQQLIAKNKAENKQITPELLIKLQQEAIRLADQAKPADPYLAEMRQMRIEELRRKQNIPQDLSPAQFNMANKLADDFTRDSKDFVARAQSYQTVIAAAKDPSAAGDLSLIFAYMKMLDPGSVVREGEFATAQNTAGVPDRIRNAYNKALTGERLNPTQRTDFVRQAGNVYGASKARQDQIVATYTSRAKRAQVPADLVVMDYGIAETPAPAESTTPQNPFRPH